MPRRSADRRRRPASRIGRWLLPGREDPDFSGLIVAASLFAALEMTAGVVIGGLFAWGRAEALIFLFFRPWLLFAAALWIAPSSWRCRILFYALALLLAGIGESLLLRALGGEPWLEMLRGWAAGALAAAVIDLIVQVGARRGCAGQLLSSAVVVLVLVVPGGLWPYERLVLGATADAPAETRARLIVMTGLPLVWGEGGPFDPQSRPAAAYRALQNEFDLRPIDYLDAEALRGARLMLLAQPRALAPTELVALDAWVRAGGRVLVLADPELAWPTRLPLGDVRRAPPASLLSPLLGHWGLRLAPGGPELLFATVRDGAATRRLVLDRPGRFESSGPACAVAAGGWLARCAIGAGRATLVADADLLRDSLWAAPGARGTERHRRLSDNPLLVAGWLDRLGGIERPRAARPVHWQRPGADRRAALLWGAAPILLALALAAALRFRRR